MPAISTDTLLLVISQIAGIFLLACTMLLIGLRRIYFDAETKQPIEIELPLLGKIKTQAPAFAVIVVGAFLVFYPMARPHADTVPLKGSIGDTKGNSVTVLVVTVPNSQETLDGPGPFTMPVQLVKNASYRVKFLVDRQVITDVEPTSDKSGLAVKQFDWSPPPSETAPIETRKDVSDEELQKLGIH